MIRTSSRNTRLIKQFTDFVISNNLKQIINFPTHAKGGCLDLVLHNTDMELEVTAIESGLSDHTAIVVSAPIHNYRTPPVQHRKRIFYFKRADV